MTLKDRGALRFVGQAIKSLSTGSVVLLDTRELSQGFSESVLNLCKDQKCQLVLLDDVWEKGGLAISKKTKAKKDGDGNTSTELAPLPSLIISRHNSIWRL